MGWKLRGKTMADISRHLFRVFRRQPDMGVGFVFVVVMTVFVGFFAAEQRNIMRSVDEIGTAQHIVHKGFQTCAGNDHGFGAFNSFHLIDT